jgi:hypothetical protein
MKRSEFLKTLGLAAAGAVAAPYILPSGRLFASTGARRVNHVVVCLFAGGVRNLGIGPKNRRQLDAFDS